MSDSILYLAIVAIWAGCLIPAWLRRPNTSRSESYADADGAEHETEAGEAAAPAADEVEATAEPAVSEFEPDVRVDARARPGPAPGPSQSRQQMMRARRRMLAILASLVFITAAFVATRLVQWWICVPPVVVLVLYVLLLREIAMAEAELARKRASWEARAARDVWRRSHEAWEAERETAASASVSVSAEPTAEIIDISGRVGDQLYDQYADAAVRAVGD